MTDFCIAEGTLLVLYTGSEEYSSIYLRYSTKIPLVHKYLQGERNFFQKKILSLYTHV